MSLALVGSVFGRLSGNLSRHTQSAFNSHRNGLLALFSTSPEMKEKIDKMVKSKKVVVFMKGVPNAPRCGFSNAVTQILRMHGVEYDAHDVLSDEELRQGVKDYTNWPTIPQVYIDGQFVGGCDILLELHKSGELISILQNIGVKSALADKQKE